MANVIDETGITTSTQAELITYFTAAYQTIYGLDIDLSQDSPDGQWMMIQIQAVLDLEDLITQVYSGFDPDLAIGNTLDMRCAINGIQREVGTYSTTDITLVASQALNIYGLDQTDQPIYTVSDNEGNEWELVQSQVISGAGTNIYEFRSKVVGAVLTIPNTITVPVTIVLGVTSVNNPTVYTTLGTNEESDASLRVRRAASVSLSTQGYLSGLLAALENVEGLTFAYVKENNTGSTDSDGVPGHSIWVIVAGNGANIDIAQAIYVKRNAGCGMYASGFAGAQSYAVTQVDGSSFTVYWDEVVEVPLYIVFTATSLDKLNPPNIAAIQAGLPALFLPGVAEQVNINDLATFVQAIDSNTLVTGAGFNIATPTQVITFSGIAASGTFKISYKAVSSAAINWNDNAATIQTRIRAIAGGALAAITVAGTIGSQTLTITMTGVSNPALLGYNTNSLATVAPAAITLNFVSAYTNTLSPVTKNKQFVVTAENTIVLTMILSGGTGIVYNINATTGVVTNTTLAIAAAGTFTFQGLGGYRTLTYSVSSGTGGAINSSTGVYTAGTAGTDTATVRDELGYSAFCTITVS